MVLAQLRRSNHSAQSAFDAAMANARPALDALQHNVMIADRELTVRYINPMSFATLRMVESDIRSAFGIGVDELLGGSIHRMHRDPARVEQILHQQDSFVLPHNADFAFGNVSLSTSINAFHDERGQHVGYIVSWRNISELIDAEHRAEELRELLNTSAAAVEELNISIVSISNDTSQVADIASQVSDKTSDIAQKVVTLDARRAEIDVAMTAINAVAEQTKLLALNATIEAARAGEAGKGFAVVAGEVKDLANSTALATEDVSEHLRTITQSITSLRNDLETMGGDIHQIDEFQTSIAGAVEEQAAVAGSIAQNINEAADRAN
ncbi:MAG: methyl-accepting chemotaxis protein [Acidimicrobiales bacterium]